MPAPTLMQKHKLWGHISRRSRALEQDGAYCEAIGGGGGGGRNRRTKTVLTGALWCILCEERACQRACVCKEAGE